ncbi:MAG: cysteine peptidase family C39 domain-containing protein [Planctomycetota bacterium]|jgi:predicted double-glycine peptidase
MTLWLETIGILLIAITGIVLGRWASRQSTSTRIFAMGVSFAVVGLILLSRLGGLWEQFPMLRPIAASRMRFVLLAFAVTLGLTAPLTQLRSIASRFITCLVMAFFVAILVSFPFLGPALIQSDLAASRTLIDTDGVCRQSQPFTCGPAAAVTALNRFGVTATEADLAMAARTSPVIGTSPWELYKTLKSDYAAEGVEFSFLHMRSIEQLPPEAILLAVVRDAPATDHCVAVLAVSEETITVADPMAGLVHIPRSSFNKQWRNCGILLQRPM